MSALIAKRVGTHGMHMYAVQQWVAHEAAAEHLYLAEPFLPGRMLSGEATEENARIIRVARSTKV